MKLQFQDGRNLSGSEEGSSPETSPALESSKKKAPSQILSSLILLFGFYLPRLARCITRYLSTVPCAVALLVSVFVLKEFVSTRFSDRHGNINAADGLQNN